ncbi:MAG: ATP-binding cassette domain-containing protein [Peptococcaceae bacterium]|nr:ATP-binding cassette domain-containing protein [Peptococcaceae bacterium]
MMEIKLEQVSKRYGKKTVFENLNETFASGRITGLVGDNGAGKSTLLRLIAGLDLDYTGHIYYDGQPLTKPLYQQMTMVFQTPYLLKRSVYDNIAYPLQLRHRPAAEIRQKTDAMIKRFGIENLAKQYAHKLSGGESQKVALARALIFEPELVLLDEPMSGIDAASVRFMEQMIQEYAKEHHKTVIMITHNARQAEELCDGIVHLKAASTGGM